jgi:hypothetical protein
MSDLISLRESKCKNERRHDVKDTEGGGEDKSSDFEIMVVRVLIRKV